MRPERKELNSYMVVHQELLKILSTESYRAKFANAKANRTCICCGNKSDTFRDSYVKLEYSISALCQDCQDRLFHPEND